MILILIPALFAIVFSLIKESPVPQFFETRIQAKALAMHIRIFGHLRKTLKNELGLSETFFTRKIKYQPSNEYTQEFLQSIDEWQKGLVDEPKFTKIENEVAMILNDIEVKRYALLYVTHGYLCKPNYKEHEPGAELSNLKTRKAFILDRIL
jgi:hypothetical protein